MKCISCKKEYSFSQQELDFYKRIKLEPSLQCQDCRLLWRLQWRNERTLYQDKCALCGGSIISRYNPKNGYKSYCLKCFNSDKWHGSEYGQDFNFKKTFNENFEILLKNTPKQALSISRYESCLNSDYCNFAGSLTNCYLIFNTTFCEESYYCRGLLNAKDLIDCYFCDHVEIGYQNINVNNSYSVFYCQNCESCRDCWFCYGCNGCSDCFGCLNMVNQQYRWFDQKLSEQEYKDKISKIKLSKGFISATREKLDNLRRSIIVRENENRNTITSVGNYLFNSKGCYNCLESQSCEDCLYGYCLKPAKDCYGCFGFAQESEILYETVAVGFSYDVSLSADMSYCQGIGYSFEVKKLKNSFGCAAMYQGGENYIFNKKYNEKEFNKLKEKIIDHMKKTGEYGLFFRPEISPFCHNETIANEYFPLTKEGALANGLKWEDNLPGTYGKETTSSAAASLDATKEILACAKCKKNFKIIPQELKFYQKYNLPLPNWCFECRHLDRVMRRGPWKPNRRNCSKCNKEIWAYVSLDHKLVYCEDCYRKEIY